MSNERIYGKWAGNEKGVPEDKTRCVKTVYPAGGWIQHQCRRKRVIGEYCKQHAPKEQS